MAKSNVDCDFAIFVFCEATQLFPVYTSADCGVVELDKVIVHHSAHTVYCVGHGVYAVMRHTAVGGFAVDGKHCLTALTLTAEFDVVFAEAF